MADQRRKNVNWRVAEVGGDIGTWERVGIAVLMDIRDELQDLNRLLRCDNFLSIPKALKSIQRNTTKKRVKKP